MSELSILSTLQVRCVWSLANGLLVERSIPSDGGCGLEGLPTLFTLLHPSDDLCPVTSRRPAEGESYICRGVVSLVVTFSLYNSQKAIVFMVDIRSKFSTSLCCYAHRHSCTPGIVHGVLSVLS